MVPHNFIVMGELVMGEVSGTPPSRLLLRVGFCCQCNFGELGRREQDESLLDRLFDHERGGAYVR